MGVQVFVDVSSSVKHAPRKRQRHGELFQKQEGIMHPVYASCYRTTCKTLLPAWIRMTGL